MPTTQTMLRFENSPAADNTPLSQSTATHNRGNTSHSRLWEFSVGLSFPLHRSGPVTGRTTHADRNGTTPEPAGAGECGSRARQSGAAGGAHTLHARPGPMAIG
eukprot:5485101-Prymnesium_polylepis.1